MTSGAPHTFDAPLVFVGNAVRAAGYRLGDFATDVAERLPPARLEAWLARGAPPLVIAPRADGTCSRADPAERVRIQLGLEA